VRRKILRVTQERLATAARITFQQIQNYERGTNRLGASTLYEIANMLSVPVEYFFEGLPDPVTNETDNADVIAYRLLAEFVDTPEGMELAENFARILRKEARHQILELVRSKARTAQSIK